MKGGHGFRAGFYLSFSCVFPICQIIALLSAIFVGQVFAATLSGSIVDAADGGTPVHPVDIDLIDPETGTIIDGFSVRNEPNGSYEITNIPTGDYKVLFNAVTTANHYLDELYDDVFCDNGGCDRANLGQAISIAGVASTLNIGMDSASVISGTVTDSTGAPLPNIAIYLYDENGEYVCCSPGTETDGTWSQPITKPGTYYAVMGDASLIGFLPEVWNDRACDGCDVTTTGDPINFGSSDVTGVDFQLSHPRPITGACGTSELILANSFEPLPDHKIRFLTDSSTVFTTAGQETTFAVEYLDENDQPLDGNQLEWCLEDNTLLDIVPQGGSVRVISTGHDVTSVRMTVRDPRTSISTNAVIMFADLQPGARYINSEWVIDRSNDITSLVLRRNAQTEKVKVGDILVSGDKAGVLVRVLAVTLDTNTVSLVVETASLTQAFQNLDMSHQSSSQMISVQYDSVSSNVSVAQRTPSSNRTRLKTKFSKLQCKKENSLFDVGLDEAKIDLNFEMELFGDLRINDGTVDSFYFYSVQKMAIEPSTGSINFSSQLSGKVSCELPLPEWTSPRLPVSAGSIGLNIQPKLGLEIEGSINGPSLSLAGPKGSLVDVSTSGFSYTQSSGWEAIRSSTYDVETTGFEAKIDNNVDFGLHVHAYGGADLELSVNLGNKYLEYLNYELATVKFVELQAGISMHAELSAPFNYRDPKYTGPDWAITGNINGKFKPELTGGAIAEFFDWLGVSSTNFSISGNLFDPVSHPFTSSPVLVEGAINCSHPDCFLDYSLNDSAEFLLSLDFARQGSIFYFGVLEDFDTPETHQLGFGSIINGDASSLFIPKNSHFPGTYRTKILVQTDSLSQQLPYSLDTSDLPKLRLGSTYQLTLSRLNLSDNLPTTAGLISSAPAGINCGDACTYRFPAFDDIVLTAHSTDEHQFVRWAYDNDNGTCSGSTDPVCSIWMYQDLNPKAIFSTNSRVEVELKGNGTGSVVSEPEGINCPDENCSALLPTGTYLALTAIADPGSSFHKWHTGSGCGFANPCYVTLDENPYIAKPIFTRPLAQLTFSDPALRTCVLNNATRDDGGPAQTGFEVNRLWCPSAGIQNLEGIEQLTELRDLDLQGNNISDVASLGALQRLEHVSLRENNLEDVSALGSLKLLRHLDIGQNLLTDISSLSTLTQMVVFAFDYNQIRDVDVISNMTELYSLTLQSNAISDLQGFATFARNGGSLTSLDLSHNQITDITPLNYLVELQILHADFNAIASIGDLSNLGQLRSLSLRHASVSDVSGLAGLSALETLDMYDNPVNSISALSGLVSLTNLSLSNTGVSDVSPLTSLTQLNELNIANYGRISCAQQSSFPWVATLSVSGWYDANGNGLRDGGENCE